MEKDRVVLVKCKLSRGLVESQRIFRIDAPGGGSLYGSADLRYCFMPQRQKLQPHMASTDQEEDGLVLGILVESKEEESLVRVQLPNGDVYEINEDLVDAASESAVR